MLYFANGNVVSRPFLRDNNSFLTFPACFWIPIIFYDLNYNCSNLLDMRNLQEQVKKAFCYQKLFWPFTVWINCSSDLKNFANSRPSASNFKSFSQSLEQFFLTVGQNNFGNKIPFLWIRKEMFLGSKGNTVSEWDAGWAVVVSDNRTKKCIRIQTGGGRGPPVSTGRFSLVPLYSKKTIYIEMTFRNGLWNHVIRCLLPSSGLWTGEFSYWSYGVISH